MEERGEGRRDGSVGMDALFMWWLRLGSLLQVSCEDYLHVVHWYILLWFVKSFFTSSQRSIL